MKKLLLFSFVCLTVSLSAQKLKGSKVVTTKAVEIGAFSAIEVSDNIDLFLTKSDQSSAEIEADDNLLEALSVRIEGGVLLVSATEPIGSFKQFSLKLNYADDLKKITAKGDASVTAMNDLALAGLEIKLLDNAKLYANIRVETFHFASEGKSKTEINYSGKMAHFECSGSATVKALVTCDALKLDLYQKANATIEGDCDIINLLGDNNSRLVGKNLTGKQVTLETDNAATLSVEVLEKVVIKASGRSNIELYGDPRIEIEKFSDSAVISKKNNKVK